MRWRALAFACSLALTLACAAPPVGAAAPANQADWNKAVQRRMISSLQFPPEARRLHGPISLSLQLTVLRDGTIADVTVGHSSGDDAVDRAAARMVRRAGPLPAFPADMTGEKTALSLPLRFQQEEDEPADGRTDDRGPPGDIVPRRYADAATGLAVTVPSPLRVGPVPARGRFDALIEISSPDGFPPRARDAKYLCRVGFLAAPPWPRAPRRPPRQPGRHRSRPPSVGSASAARASSCTTTTCWPAARASTTWSRPAPAPATLIRWSTTPSCRCRKAASAWPAPPSATPCRPP